ncbi:MAG TPA: PhnD/SsuA/transferrin family substrate-binding protein [Thermoanaerobaculia bacterium]
MPKLSVPRLYAWLLLLAVLWAVAASPAAAQTSVKFVSIDQDDQKTADADEILRALLERKLGEPLNADPLDYAMAIKNLSDSSARMRETPYLARVTPYVYIAAEMLGADFEIVGTYISKATVSETNPGTTYHSYFVVNREALDSSLELRGKQPDLDDLLEFVRNRAAQASPARFVYHSRFSTSSFFLPALFFRRNSIFDMSESTPGLTAIQSEEIGGNSSSRLVEEVADGGAQLAAVWDGTMVKFLSGEDAEQRQRGEKVYFIPLPTELPNDLLVCSRSLLKSPQRRSAVRKLFTTRGGGSARLEIDKADFLAWVDINQAGKAWDALADLRWLASERRTPVVVRVARGRGIPGGYLEAARQGVRLSGTEFVLYDNRFHKKVDYDWTLGWVREGHITLTSDIPAFGVKPQVFRISFQPASAAAEEQDLTQRIGNILASRVHRIRYIWPYDDDPPLVIRDVPFSLAPGTPVAVQKIRWTDPLHNLFTGLVGPSRVAVEGADFFKFRLVDKEFRLAMGDARGVDPMSREAYRVLLERPPEPQTVFHVFNVVFFALVGLSGTGTVLAFRRSRRA